MGLFKEDRGCERFEEMMECERLWRWRIKNELECEWLRRARKSRVSNFRNLCENPAELGVIQNFLLSSGTPCFRI